jgi:hypothetical protein
MPLIVTVRVTRYVGRDSSTAAQHRYQWDAGALMYRRNSQEFPKGFWNNGRYRTKWLWKPL